MNQFSKTNHPKQMKSLGKSESWTFRCSRTRILTSPSQRKLKTINGMRVRSVLAGNNYKSYQEWKDIK